jgi:hypothetical protein
MRRGLICAAIGLALATTMAQAATDNERTLSILAARRRAPLWGHWRAMRWAVDMPLRAPGQAPRLDTMTKQRLRRSKKSSRCGASGVGRAPSSLIRRCRDIERRGYDQRICLGVVALTEVTD